MIKGFVLRTLYGAMLRVMKPEMVAEFWREFELPSEEGVLKGKRMLDKIWTPGQTFPVTYAVEVLNQFEQFCLKKSIDVDFFLEEMANFNQGTYLTPIGTLCLLNDSLPGIFRNEKDVRKEHLLALGDFSVRVLGEDLPIYTWDIPDSESHYKVLTTIGCYDVPEFKVENAYWFSRILAAIPKRFSFAKTGKLKVLSDTRDLQTIITSCGADVHYEEFGGKVFVDGCVLGYYVELQETKLWDYFELREQFPKGELRVFLADDDWYCPIRKRNVVEKGVVYEAPYAASEIHFFRNEELPANPIQGVIEQAASDSPDAWDKVEDKHHYVQSIIDPRLIFNYYKSQETMDVNGDYLIRSAPAAILHEVLRRWKYEGQRVFSNKELRRIPGLGLEGKNHYLESRLYLIRKRLEEKLGGKLTLEKSGWGKFTLKTNCHLEVSLDD